MNRISKFVILLLVGGVVFPTVPMAATIFVPSGHPDLATVRNVVSPGDVVVVEDSATYTGDVYFNKPYTIYAASGQTPTIVGNNSIGGAVYMDSGSDGSRVGCVDPPYDGKITIDTGAAGKPCIRIDPGAIGTLNFENLNLLATSAQAIWSRSPSGIQNYTLVAVDGGGDVGGNMANLFEVDNRAGGTINCLYFTISNKNQTGLSFNGPEAMFLDGGYGTLNIDRCSINVNGNGLILQDEEGVGWSGLPWNINITDSCFVNFPGDNATYPFRCDLAADVTATRSVFANDSPNYRGAIYNNGDFGGAGVTQGSDWVFDHCDLVCHFDSVDGSHAVEIYINETSGGADPRTFSFTNCNISGRGGILYHTDTGETVISDYNNIVSTNEDYRNVTAGANDLNGTNGLGEFPNYADIYGCLSDYDNAALLNASSAGTAIGAFNNATVPVEISSYGID